jgi:hypothetical protein
MRHLFAAALLAALTPAAAHAADVASIGCIRAELGETVYHAIVAGRAANWEASLNETLGKDTNAFLDAVQRCTKAHGWSEAAGRFASMYVKSQITLDGAELMLRQSGVDPAGFEAEYARLPAADRRLMSAENSATTPEQAVQVILRVYAAMHITPKDDDPSLRYVAALMAAVATIEFLPEKFTAA